MKATIIVFLLGFGLSFVQAQPLISISEVEVWRLVEEVDYAESHLLRVKEKYFLIDSLLSYEGDLDRNPNWKINFNPVPDEMRSSRGGGMFSAVTNQAVALYLIECVVRDSMWFDHKVTYPIYAYTEEEREELGKGDTPVKRLSSIGTSEYVNFDSPYLSPRLNIEHFSKLFSYYKEWRAIVKRRGVEFEDLTEEERRPLKGTRYGWTMKDLFADY